MKNKIILSSCFFPQSTHSYPHHNSTAATAAAPTVVLVVVVKEEEEERGLSMVDCHLSFIYFDLIQLFVIIMCVCVCLVSVSVSVSVSSVSVSECCGRAQILAKNESYRARNLAMQLVKSEL